MSSIFDGIGDDGIEQLDENLRKWFKEKWVRFGPDGKIRGACARGDDSEGKPKCLPQKKAHALGKKGRKYAAAKKRREDPNPERRGKAKNVATKKKTNEGIPFNQCPECGGEIVHESMMNEKKDACYHKVKARYKVWPSAYASGALVQCRKKGASNWGNGGKKNESNIMKGLVAETEMMSVIYVDGHPLVKYVNKTQAETDAERVKKKFPHRNVEVKREMHEGVIVGHDAKDPEVAILGGGGTMSLSRLKSKAHGEAMQLMDDIAMGKFKSAAYNIKQLENSLATIKAAEEEMEKLYFGEGEVIPYKKKKSQHEKYADAFSKQHGEEHRYGVGWIECPYCGNENCDYDCDESQADGFNEDTDMRFAAEKTPAINPYGGLKDKQHRGAISETPTDNPTGASGEGGWRKYKAKSAGTVEEDTAYAGGMGQGGNAGQSYRKFKPKSAGTFKEDELDEACWKGYHKEGMKTMFGKKYPNCVKNTNEELDEPKESSIMKGLTGKRR